MNILHVITHGGWAGSESIAAAIANEQANRGHNVFVILRKNNSYKKNEIASNFNKDIKLFWVEQSETHPTNQIKTLIKDNSFIEHIVKIDILHAHLPYGCLLGDILKKQFSLKFQICVSMHVRFHPLYDLADKIFTVAQWQQMEIPKNYSGKIYTIENFLCIKENNNLKKINIFKKKHHISDSEKYIVFLGRLDLVKGPDILIRAFNKANLEGYKLLLIGDGPELKTLTKIAQKNVIFTGKISDAACFLELADITVVPSRFESFGLVLVEAVNAGSRVIASNIPSFKEILDNEDLLFENESVDSLCNKIIEYSKNPHIGYAKPSVIQKFSLRRSLDKLENVYLEIDNQKELEVDSDKVANDENLEVA